MRADDKARLISLYEERFRLHGTSVKTLGWNAPEDQELRFDVLADIGDLRGKRICDIGCGFGDLLPYLQRRFRTVDYTGIDIVESLINEAKRRHRNARFLCLDILEEPFTERFDFLLLSGALSFRIQDNLHHSQAVIRRMFDLCDEAIGLNFLSTYVNFERQHNYHHSPEEMFSFAKNITPWVTLRHDYPLWEFTVFLYKRARKWRSPHEPG